MSVPDWQDANFLLLKTQQEVEQWQQLQDASGLETLPQFAPVKPEKAKRGFPEYPEGDLIAQALHRAFVEGGE